MTNEEGHRKLWGRLAETGGSSKKKAFRELWPKKKIILNECFYCIEAEIRRDKNNGRHTCIYCPTIWADGKQCNSPNGEYTKWVDAVTPEDRKHWAAIIRDLPWDDAHVA
jgi:hypothetical protein